MIGKPHWFKRRKYGGWGFWPACWQGWLYLAILLGSFAMIQAIPAGNDWNRIVIMIIWAVVFSADAVHIFLALPKDEREVMHEAKAERNAMWVMVFVLAIGVAYQVATGAIKGWQAVDPVIIAALAAGLIVKAGTNVYLDSKE
jgi:hypothetical protein